MPRFVLQFSYSYEDGRALSDAMISRTDFSTSASFRMRVSRRSPISLRDRDLSIFGPGHEDDCHDEQQQQELQNDDFGLRHELGCVLVHEHLMGVVKWLRVIEIQNLRYVSFKYKWFTYFYDEWGKDALVLRKPRAASRCEST